MGECQVCGEEGSLREVTHEDRGRLMVCKGCWTDIYEEGKKVAEGTGSGSDSSGLGCPHCG